MEHVRANMEKFFDDARREPHTYTAAALAAANRARVADFGNTP